jgi:hypothetical protein
MSTLNNHDDFAEPYDMDIFNVPLLLRGLSIQEPLQGPEDWHLGKHERGFFGDEERDLDELIQQNANKRVRYSDEDNIQGEFAPFSLYQAYPATLNLEMPFTPVSDSNQTSSFESQELSNYLSTESPVSHHSSEDSSLVQVEEE